MKRAVFRGAAIAAVAVGWATGCMPESLEVGRAVVDAGAGDMGEGDGGTGSSDGGTSLGGTAGHSGASSAGRGASGGRNGDASGGAGTTSAGAGGSSGGGIGGGGASGAAGKVGDPRISFDPACDCTAVIDDDYGDFSCTVPLALFDAHFDPPENCDLDQTDARTWSCDDGTDHYEWLVSDENAYKMVLAGETLIYGTAFGYDLAKVCDFSYTDPKVHGEVGSLRAGTEPEAECFEACSICETVDPDLPRCPACVTLPDRPYVVIQSLEEYCMHRDCPETVADARALLASQCHPPSDDDWSVIRRGCGLVRVERSWGQSGSAYFYDETSGVLLGASEHDDVGRGECKVPEYRGGDIPMEACSETTTCDVCPWPGAGGEGGTSGEYEPCPP